MSKEGLKSEGGQTDQSSERYGESGGGKGNHRPSNKEERGVRKKGKFVRNSRAERSTRPG